MARNPLYPRTPGEQAVDRFLNDTLPRLLEARKQEQMDREKFDYQKEQDLINQSMNKQSLDLRKQQNTDNWIGTQKEDYTDLYETAENYWLRGEEDRGDRILEEGFKAMTTDFTKRGLNIDKHITTYAMDLETGADSSSDANVRQDIWADLTNPQSSKTEIMDALTLFWNNPRAFPAGTKSNQDVVDWMDKAAISDDPRYVDLQGSIVTAANFSKQSQYRTKLYTDSASTDPDGIAKIRKTFEADLKFFAMDAFTQDAAVLKRYNETYGKLNKQKSQNFITNIRSLYATPDNLRKEMGLMDNIMQDMMLKDGFYAFTKNTTVDYKALGFGDMHKKVLAAQTEYKDEAGITHKGAGAFKAFEKDNLDNPKFKDYKLASRRAIKKKMIEFGYLKEAVDRQFPMLVDDTGIQKKEIETATLTESEQLFKDAGFEFKQSDIDKQKDLLKNLGTLEDIQGNKYVYGDTVSDEALIQALEQGHIKEDGTVDPVKVKDSIAGAKEELGPDTEIPVEDGVEDLVPEEDLKLDLINLNKDAIETYSVDRQAELKSIYGTKEQREEADAAAVTKHIDKITAGEKSDTKIHPSISKRFNKERKSFDIITKKEFGSPLSSLNRAVEAEEKRPSERMTKHVASKMEFLQKKLDKHEDDYNVKLEIVKKGKKYVVILAPSEKEPEQQLLVGAA